MTGNFHKRGHIHRISAKFQLNATIRLHLRPLLRNYFNKVSAAIVNTVVHTVAQENHSQTVDTSTTTAAPEAPNYAASPTAQSQSPPHKPPSEPSTQESYTPASQQHKKGGRRKTPRPPFFHPQRTKLAHQQLSNLNRIQRSTLAQIVTRNNKHQTLVVIHRLILTNTTHQ